jgi:hypothetical protein
MGLWILGTLSVFGAGVWLHCMSGHVHYELLTDLPSRIYIMADLRPTPIGKRIKADQTLSTIAGTWCLAEIGTSTSWQNFRRKPSVKAMCDCNGAQQSRDWHQIWSVFVLHNCASDHVICSFRCSERLKGKLPGSHIRLLTSISALYTSYS